MPTIFANGQSIVVTAHGTGRLHLLTYQSNGGLPDVVGTTTTTNEGNTRFMLSHSYTFNGFAFYWDGTGEAVYRIGTGLQKSPVGTSWGAASNAAWGESVVTSKDVTSIVPAAKTRDNEITCFIIPDEV